MFKQVRLYSNVISQVNKVWSLSLGGHRGILTGAGMFRTPVFIVGSQSVLVLGHYLL